MKEAADKGSGDMVNRGSCVKRITEKPVDLAGVAVTVTLLPQNSANATVSTRMQNTCRIPVILSHQGFLHWAVWL